jgi:hypothetical protein
MRTNWLCKQLDELAIPYFREPQMNIVAIRSSAIPKSVAQKFNLVPQSHDESNLWYKIVVMDHVEIEHLKDFMEVLKSSKINDAAGIIS